MNQISWDDFEQVDIRTGTIVAVEDFKAARKPAYLVSVDFGDEIGTKCTSAQIKQFYCEADLIGRQVLGVVNLPPKQIGPIMSEFLLTGFYHQEGVVLVGPERPIANGLKLG